MATAAGSILTLPYVTVQADLTDVISDVEQGTVAVEDFWVSCYRFGTKGVHGKVRVTAVEGQSEVGYELEARDGITCERVDSLTMRISCPSLSIPPTKVLMPRQTLRKIQRVGVECMDVAGDLVATGGKNGSLRVDAWRGDEKGSEPSYGRGHVGDLTTVKFLPSGQVLLTASLDLSARIFAASPPPDSFVLPNPRTFHAPHTRGVSATAPLGRGRFILTACRDGALRVWEVKTAAVVAEGIWPGGSGVGVEAMAVCALPSDTLPESETTEGEPEPWPPRFVYSLSVILALSSGAVHIVSLPSLRPLASERQLPRPPSAPSPLDALDVGCDGTRLAVGSRNGVVTVFSLSSTTGSVVSSWRRTEAGVNALKFADNGSLAIAGADGLPYVIRCRNDGNFSVEEEWGGFDADPVSSIVLAEGRSFAAGGDGCVRIYARSS